MRKINPFTLLELILAMGILAVIMMIMLSFFSAAQKAWMTSSANAEIYENARIAMDLMTRDLQAALYNDENSTKGICPFWHESESRINFISSTNVGDNTNDTSNIREVKYARGDSNMYQNDLNEGTKLKPGWLVRSVTGNYCVDPSYPNDKTKPLNKYNFTLFPKSDGDGQRAYKVFKEIAGGTDDANKSSVDFNHVVPYVLSLKFTCYNNSLQDMVANGIYTYNSSTAAPSTPFPYAIKIELTLLDRVSWLKWKALGGDVDNPDSDSVTPKKFREAQQRTFTKMIYLGERNSIYIGSGT